MKKRGDEYNFFTKKYGQITIFIVTGLLIVVGIFLFFVFRNNISPQTGGNNGVDFNSYLSSCLNSKVGDAVQNLSLQGGYNNDPSSINFEFTSEGISRNITYLCYTGDNFVPCINQKPLLLNDLSNNIKMKISDNVKNCFNNMVTSLQNQGYGVNSNYNGFNVSLFSKKIEINIDGQISLTKPGQTSTQNGFKVDFLNRIYDLVIVVNEIINSETEFCNFDVTNFQITYPYYSIDSYSPGNSNIIYTITYQKTGEKFRFAIRGCNLPYYV